MHYGTEMITSHFGVKRSKVKVMVEYNMLETAILAFTTPLGGGMPYLTTWHRVIFIYRAFLSFIGNCLSVWISEDYCQQQTCCPRITLMTGGEFVSERWQLYASSTAKNVWTLYFAACQAVCLCACIHPLVRLFPWCLWYVLLDFHQTVVGSSTWDRDDLIRFPGQRSHSQNDQGSSKWRNTELTLCVEF